MKKALSLSLALAMVLSMLAGCSSTTSSDTGSTSTDSSAATTDTSSATTYSTDAVATDLSAEPEGVVEGTSVVMYSNADCVSQQLPGQYPGGQWMYSMVYDTLFWSPSGQWDDMTGLLVKDWTVSDDQLTWVLNLHEDVTFTNGNSLNAQSVVGSFQYHVDMGAAPYMTSIESYEATGEYQVTINLKAPNLELMEQLAVPNVAIIDASQYQEYGASVEAAYMAGSGPYYISDYGVGDYIEFTAKTDYWDEDRTAHIETITCKVILDTNTQSAALASGDCDFGQVTDYNVYETLQTYDELNFVTHVDVYRAVWMNSGDGYCEYLSNPRVREALSMMIDDETVLMATYGDYGVLTENALASDLGYEHNRVYDPDGALAILEEEGIDPSDIVLVGLCSSPLNAMFTSMQAQFMACGVTLDFTVQDDPAVMSAGMNGEWDLWAEHGGGVKSYAMNSPLSNTMSDGAAQQIVRDETYSGTVQDLVTNISSATDADEKQALMVELLTLVDEEYLYIDSFANEVWYAYADNIENVIIDVNAAA